LCNRIVVRLTKEYFLKHSSDFDNVFKHNCVKVKHHCFLMLVVKNTQVIPRLGLAIAKKHTKKAVQRNYLKRIIRESFRHHIPQLANVDIVVLAIRSSSNDSNKQLWKSINQAWQLLLEKLSC